MTSKINDIHLRRGQLLERIANQRSALKQETLPVQTLLARADRVVAYSRKTADFVTRHLGVILVISSLVVIRKPRVCWRWAQRGFVAWQLWQRVDKNFTLFRRFFISR